jgi:hypothetical protein
MKKRLSRTMTEKAFDEGYWYALELKEFATALGLPSAGKLRKDELELAIKTFFRTGKAEVPIRRALSRDGVKDTARGLSLRLPVVNYTNDKETKDFLVREAKKRAPGLKEKSGARYRLNRWREAQLASGKRIVYDDLVRQYVKLNQTKGRFAQAPTGRYINFLSDFFAAEPDATRADGLRAWKQLKGLDLPKTYRAWKSRS